PQDHPSATLSCPALLHEEGKVKRVPLLVEEGWREAPGRWGSRAAGPPVRGTVASCPPPRGGQNPTRSPPRRGGVARSAGVVGFTRRRTTRPRHCRVLPSSTRRAESNAFPSSSRRGGAQRRGGGV